MNVEMLPLLMYLLIPLLVLSIVWWLLSHWIVNVGPTQLAIVERRFLGAKLPTGRVFAAEAEVGIQARYLAPGLHFVLWPVMRVVDKVEFVTIGSDELGVITAADGEPMPSGRVFAQLVGEAQTDPLIQQELRTHLVDSRRELFRAIWDRGVARGELRGDVDPEAAIDLVIGPALYRLVIGHAPLTEAAADAIVDVAVRGLAGGD